MSARRSQRARSQTDQNPLSVFASLMEDRQSDDETDDEAESTMPNLVGDQQMWEDDDNVNDDDDDDGNGGNIPMPRRRITGTPHPPITDDSEEEDSDEIDEENAGAEQDIAGRAPRRGRRLLHRNKQINSLEEANNPANYNMMQMPGAAEAKVLSAILEKTPRNQPDIKIEWTNQQRSNRGRTPR